MFSILTLPPSPGGEGRHIIMHKVLKNKAQIALLNVSIGNTPHHIRFFRAQRSKDYVCREYAAMMMLTVANSRSSSCPRSQYAHI